MPTVPGVIRSPIEGIVVEKLINPGEVIQGGQTQCFTIANLSTVWVMANVFESDLAAVTKGESARITTDASPDTLVGHVDYVAALVDTATRATGVRILVENRHEILKRDMYVRVGDSVEQSAHRTAGTGGVGAARRPEPAVRLRRRGRRRIRPPPDHAWASGSATTTR